jgi:hypothetical protein
VVGVDAKDVLEVAPVQTSSQSRHSERTVRTNRSAIAFAFGARTGVLTIRMPWLRKTSSKGPLYLLSRSRMRKRTPLSLKSRPRLRACCVTQDRLDCEEVTRNDAGRLRAQELAPARPAAARRRLVTDASKKPPDARRRDDEAELAQLATDPAMTPAWVLARNPEHQLLHLRGQRRTSNLTGRLAPLSSHECLMPTQQCPRRHQEHGSRRARQVSGCSGQQRSIRHSELRPHNLAA